MYNKKKTNPWAIFVQKNNQFFFKSGVISLRMTTKPMALDQVLKKHIFYLKKERKPIYVTDEKNYPSIGW